MQVPPHPHIGLQNASWLFHGLVLHRDSLGSAVAFSVHNSTAVNALSRTRARPGPGS